MVRKALHGGRPVITIEDHSISGGFGSAVLETAQMLGLDASQLTRLGLPVDRFIAHGSRAGQLAECNLDASGIATTLLQIFEKDVPRLSSDDSTAINVPLVSR